MITNLLITHSGTWSPTSASLGSTRCLLYCIRYLLNIKIQDLHALLQVSSFILPVAADGNECADYLNGYIDYFSKKELSHMHVLPHKGFLYQSLNIFD